MGLTDLAEDVERQRALNDARMFSIWHETIKPLISQDLIDEHRADPTGHHSPALNMILCYLRSHPVRAASHLIVVIVKPEQEWAIGEFPPALGAPVYVRPGVYQSVDEIEHAIFLERLALVEAAFGGGQVGSRAIGPGKRGDEKWQG